MRCFCSLGLLAHLSFEDGPGVGGLGGLTTEPEDMVGALGIIQLWGRELYCSNIGVQSSSGFSLG